MAVTGPVNSGYTIINGTTTGSNGSKVNTWVEYKVTAQSVANNTSTIRVVLYSQATWDSGTIHETTKQYGYVKIDNTQQSYTMTGGYDFGNMKLNKFADHTFTVTHGTDGKKTVTIGGAWSDIKSDGKPWSTYISGGSASKSVTLPQIARASTVSSFSGTLGSSGNITITRQDNSFTHTLQYSFDNSNWTNIETGVGASCSWTPSVSLISNFSNQKTKTGYLRCITYSGSTQVGTSTSTLTLTAPSSSLANVRGTYGTALTLTATNACASGLTYTFQYYDGSSWVSIATGSTSKTQSWTPPTSLIANVNNSGTGTVSIRVITYVGTATVNTATGAATLTITTNTSSNREGTIGSELTIPINKAHSKLTSTITYSFGNQSNIQIVSKTTSTSYSWTPATSLLSEIPNATSGTGTIKIETFNGTQSLGSNSYTLTLSAASSVIPSASFGSPTRVNTNATVESWGIYLQGYSAVKLKLTATGNSGSTIARMSISGQGISSSSTPGTTPAYLETTSSVFSSAGTFSYIGEAKDTRGRSAARATSSNVVVQAYTSPTVSNVRIVRCNSDGTEDSAGASLKVTFSRSFTQVGQNAFTAHLEYKESGGNWQTITATELDPAISNIFNLGLHAEYNYYTRIRYSDSLSGYKYSQEITVASDARIMNVNPSGSGLAIGGFSTQTDTLQVYYPADFMDGVTVDGKDIILKMYNDTSGTDWKAMLKAKVDYVRTNGTSGKTYIMQGGWAGQAYGYSIIYWTNTYVVCDFYGLGGRWYRCVYNGSDYSYYRFNEDGSNDYTYNGLTIRARRRGSTCDIYVTGTTTSDISTSGASVTLCTLPEMYRPMYSYVNLVFMQANLMGQLNITTAGAVNLGYTHTITTSANVNLASGTSIWARTTYAVQ